MRAPECFFPIILTNFRAQVKLLRRVVAEHFFATVEFELIMQSDWLTREAARPAKRDMALTHDRVGRRPRVARACRP